MAADLAQRVDRTDRRRADREPEHRDHDDDDHRAEEDAGTQRRSSRAVNAHVLTASITCRNRSTMRGPQRDAMSSSSATTLPFCTAAIVDQPGRCVTVSSDCAQHFVSARKMKSGLAVTMLSCDSCGYPLPSSAASPTFFKPVRPSTAPMNVFDV